MKPIIPWVRGFPNDARPTSDMQKTPPCEKTPTLTPTVHPPPNEESSLGLLVIKGMPIPPPNLFSCAYSFSGDYNVETSFRSFFSKLQGLLRKTGFDEISFSGYNSELQWQFTLLESVMARLLESPVPPSPGMTRLFETSSYYYHLMGLYHGLLQNGLQGIFDGTETECVLLLMRYIDFEISLLGFLDSNGGLNLSCGPQIAREQVAAAKMTFQQLAFTFKGDFNTAVIIEVLQAEHSRLAAIFKSLESSVFWYTENMMTMNPLMYSNMYPRYGPDERYW
ncbi:hypothetical protein JCM33374_g1662 [Metschnikowia sp. JCM 33374]|nr:hypothetical protein JCM33374_g1662 [Metschnikowia sp. JCM 33374]